MQGFLFDNCFFSIFDEETVRSCSAFSCGDDDLDEFFIKDSSNYAKEKVIKFYIKCGFDFVFSTEEQEKVYASYPKEDPLATRLMVFDLIHIVEKS